MLTKKVTKSTVIFETDKIKQTLVTKDTNDKTTEAGRVQLEKHTLRVEFDFEKVTEDEILSFLTSTTSTMKMFQNNVTKHWTEADILKHVAEGVYILKVRELLDNRESKQLTDEETRRRMLKKEIGKGKTKEQIKEEFLASLEDM